MTTFAAYDHNSIYALGVTPEAAIQNARNAAREPDAEFKTARIRAAFAALIDENGWDGMNRSFEIDQDGFLVDTTGHGETTMAWKQPDPTKRYAVFYDGSWYGEGDTPEVAWADVRRQLSPQHDRYGAALYAKIRREGQVKESAIAAPVKWTPETARQRVGGTFGT